MPKTAKVPADYILPLNINGLEGRMLFLPASKGRKRNVLFVYGQHSSLERWWGLALVLNDLGSVTMPDMPGFGNMTPLYKIGQKATIDNLADYLAAFIKLRFKGKKITIVGMSLGFVVITRMLQRYPEMSKQVDDLVSIVGFGHNADFIFPPVRKRFYVIASKFLSLRLPAWGFKLTFLQPFYLRRVYKHSRFAKEKLAHLSGREFKEMMDAELLLWRINDIRTQMQTNYEMMTLDNTHQRVGLPVFHVASHKDRYFDHVRVEEHLRKIFSDFRMYYSKDPNHAPTIIAKEEQARPFIPQALRTLLIKKK